MPTNARLLLGVILKTRTCPLGFMSNILRALGSHRRFKKKKICLLHLLNIRHHARQAFLQTRTSFSVPPIPAPLPVFCLRVNDITIYPVSQTRNLSGSFFSSPRPVSHQILSSLLIVPKSALSFLFPLLLPWSLCLQNCPPQSHPSCCHQSAQSPRAESLR